MRSAAARFAALLAVDLVGVNLTIYLAFLTVFGADIPERNLDAWLHVWWPVSLLKLLVFQLAGLYDDPEDQTALGTLLLSFWGSALGAVGVMALTFYSRDFAFPRSVVGLNFFYTALFLWSARVVLLVLVRRTQGPMRLLCVGVEPHALWKNMSLESLHELSPQAATAKQLRDLRLKGGRTVVVAPRETPALMDWLRDGLVDERDVDLLLVPDVADCMMGLGTLRVLGDVPVIPLRSMPMNLRQQGMKRTVDLLIAVPALVVMGALLVVLAPVLWLTQGFGVFYRQERVGLNGRTFDVIKLRTMRKDSETATGPVLAAGDKDPRVTPLGYWLRLTKIDELPQFINVFLGQMSVVGPRPERPHFVGQFEREIPLYHERHRVKPGVTGFGQVHARYHTTAQTKLLFDLLYAYNYSLATDFRLMADTVKIVLSRLARREV